MARVQRALALVVLLVMCFIKGSKSVQAASNVSTSTVVLSQLSLPEPDLVNKFLLATNTTNPLFPANESQSLQVIRCQSFTAGPVYEFYQVEAPGNLSCEYPPPELTAVVPNEWGSLKYWALFTFVYVSVALCAPFFLGIPVAFVCLSCFALIWIGWHRLWYSRDVMAEVKMQRAQLEERQRQQTLTSEGTVLAQENDIDRFFAEVSESVRQSPFLAASLFIPAVVLLLAFAFSVTSAMRELAPATKVASLGPVGLPDPSQGFNHYLEEWNASFKLDLCANANISFYVDFSNNCARLGDPYDGRRLKPVYNDDSDWLLPVYMSMFITGATMVGCLFIFFMGMLIRLIETGTVFRNQASEGAPSKS